ncbi:hypothetical protein K5549_006874 [Capra hircus]|uniref:Uncharacterized protein n=1 Tax=Capra hircus TaxID=9925 RepID=A0A452G2M0_CAPHI|nr:hypothetical protein K5549_006874 [Capra hircus]
MPSNHLILCCLLLLLPSILPSIRVLSNELKFKKVGRSTSIAQLKVVQTKYVEAKDCLNMRKGNNEGKELLPHDVEHVLSDVGTGHCVEKTRKIDFLTKQMEKIQPALQEQHAMKQPVMEMMSQKIQQLTTLGAAQAAAKA